MTKEEWQKQMRLDVVWWWFMVMSDERSEEVMILFHVFFEWHKL